MLKSIPLKCASCGSNLEVTLEMDTFACGYCGASQIVERQGGTVSLRLVTDAIRSVQVGTDKTAAELALKRLSRELESVEQEFNDVAEKKNRRLGTNGKVFGSIWIVGILFCFIIGASGGYSYYFALFLGILGTAGVIYLRIKQEAVIKSSYKGKEEELLGRGNNIQEKIAQNKRLVDM
jgi:Arc/MetJ family transcription regulator